VFIESTNGDKIGNKSPIYLNNIFTREVKGVVAMHRVNAKKVAIIFKQAITANNFINNDTFLGMHFFKAYIPAREIERTGVIRFVPTNISNKELYTKLSSQYEIISVRRFMKKVGQEIVPLQTVSVTFLSAALPNTVQYDLFSYRVSEYVAPLLQCFRCFKFNHSAKICSNKQRCSICAGEHHFKECDDVKSINCINCGGPHLAIDRSCPIKIQKTLEKKNKISYASATQKNKLDNTDFPPLPVQNKNSIKYHQSSHVNKPLAVVQQNDSVNKNSFVQDLINNKDIIAALVKTLVELGNKKDDVQINNAYIKDKLIQNLT
jgi:hypothetical protein